MSAERLLPPPSLRERLIERVTRSARASRAFVTVRAPGTPAQALADGVAARCLYEAGGTAWRPGQPRRVRIIDLAAGAAWTPELAAGDQAEWLVMAGSVRLADEHLERCDYHWAPPGRPTPLLRAVCAARVMLREAPAAAQARMQSAITRADATTPWEDFAPGIRRRVLWTRGGEAALLYQAAAGARVPGHGHRRDEECLMLDGEVFLDDLLLRQGDYQLAPAGTAHAGVSTDIGGLIFAHGDLDLDRRAD
ncbi:MAG TPA: cupin domain-containing protein [Aquabacterium sp.]|nr:cupin domain-containing protein [Aquabacterium sp.]